MNEILNMYFGIIDDKRNPVNVIYPLIDILKLIWIATLCGIDELDKIVDYGENKKKFLKEEFEIKGIPSKSTITRVMAMINSEFLNLSIIAISKTLINEKCNQIMLDGKAIKSTEAISNIDNMMNIVTAFTDTGISIGQKIVENKSNEIPAVRELIDIIDVNGKVITADAMHCQKETAKRIINNGGDYVLQLKANQGNFYEDVYAMFDDKYMEDCCKKDEYEIFETIEKSHGRIETRKCYVLNNMEYFEGYFKEWQNLRKIFCVKRIVEKKGKISEEISCYLSSRNDKAENLLNYTRNHWKIESMHHILDVTFDEDRCKLATKQAQENLNILRKSSISVHKKYIDNYKKKTGKNKTVKSNMFNCLINDAYLIEILQFCNNR